MLNNDVVSFRDNIEFTDKMSSIMTRLGCDIDGDLVWIDLHKGLIIRLPIGIGYVIEIDGEFHESLREYGNRIGMRRLETSNIYIDIKRSIMIKMDK